MPTKPIDHLSGYRRRLRVTPSNGRVLAELEDDYHCMAVTVHHDGRAATAVQPVMDRAPWSICPGAVAVLAAAHAFDTAPTVFDILVSDPVDDRSEAELRRNGIPVLDWSVVKGPIIAPAPLAGIDLDNMRHWIESLDPDNQEAARLLRWGTMVAHGRTLPADWASGTGNMTSRGRCFTFQPHKVGEAKHVGTIRDFSRGSVQPLDSASSTPQNSDLFHVTREHASRSFAGRRTP